MISNAMNFENIFFSFNKMAHSKANTVACVLKACFTTMDLFWHFYSYFLSIVDTTLYDDKIIIKLAQSQCHRDIRMIYKVSTVAVAIKVVFASSVVTSNSPCNGKIFH